MKFSKLRPGNVSENKMIFKSYLINYFNNKIFIFNLNNVNIKDFNFRYIV